jgi:putative endonuclease
MNKIGEYRKKLGGSGEEEAVRFLEKKGYRILEKNFKYGKGEIDIIAMDNNTLVFVEVKTKFSEGYGEPEEWVTRRKQAQIGRVAMGYLQKKSIKDMDCRFDVVSIVKMKEKANEIRHIEDAFWLDAKTAGRMF